MRGRTKGHTMTLKEYIAELNRQYQTGMAREHSYRPALKQLLADLLPQLTVTNEPARIDCGAPDYIVSERTSHLPVFFVEAKDIGDTDLDGRRQHKEQFSRYRRSLPRMVFTDYLRFHFYAEGELTDCAEIGAERNGRIEPAGAKEWAKFKALVENAAKAAPRPVSTPGELAEAMAAKARLLADSTHKALQQGGGQDAVGGQEQPDSQLKAEYRAFRDVLLHDLTPEAFADIYAQTITYGLFAARLHDPTPEDFSRQEAATLIPRTNPFLRKIFQSIAGYDLDERIAWIVDDIATLFLHSDIQGIMEKYGADDLHADPLMHFYEDFLAAYDTRLRHSRGVYYTPRPVVSYIVRAVDSLLQTRFGLTQGLADSSKIARSIPVEQSRDGRTTDGLKHTDRLFHRVQLLDPATGTGTFLAEAIRQIHAKFQGNEGLWPAYVKTELLPRLNGFEILMAPYTIAHLKLDLLLSQTGYQPAADSPRLHVYLTNSLEEASTRQRELFAQWLADEANQANRVKSLTPVMVMMGNPPYSISSSNKGKWITKLIDDYKQNLNERNIQPLSDDYIKFIRLAQFFVEKNGEGIVGFITNNSFLDGIIHREMRRRLLMAFDEIFILNLHGNSRIKETAPDGSKDENVFDIMPGVSINIFVKTGKKQADSLGAILYKELYGTRKFKYETLSNQDFNCEDYMEIVPQEPHFFFTPKDFSIFETYHQGFGLTELFNVSVSGIKTHKDSLDIRENEKDAEELLSDAKTLTEEVFRSKYNIGKDSRDWTVANALEDVRTHNVFVAECTYRPFDKKFLVYGGASNGIVAWPRYHLMHHLLNPQNLGIIVGRQGQVVGEQPWNLVFITNHISDVNVFYRGGGVAIPLYLDNTGEAGSIFSENELVPNFNPTIYNKVCEAAGFSPTPEQVAAYIYAALHSPRYRERYKEFLKIDFPRVPYPASGDAFRRLALLGQRLIDLHLMRHAEAWQPAATYPVDGSHTVDAPRWDGGKVWINDQQYFDNVPERAWQFFIGGYQPAQKWLKDRKGRALSLEDLNHYRRIVHAIDATIDTMAQIDLE